MNIILSKEIGDGFSHRNFYILPPNHNMDSNCKPLNAQGQAFIPWIHRVFGDCVYSAQDQVSFYIGMSSILFWLCAQAPQLYENYKRGKAEALSFWSLAAWLSGDITNLVGAILTHQLPTQVFFSIFSFFVSSGPPSISVPWMLFFLDSIFITHTGENPV